MVDAFEEFQILGVLVNAPGEADKEGGGGQSAALTAQSELVIDEAIRLLLAEEVIQQADSGFRVCRAGGIGTSTRSSRGVWPSQRWLYSTPFPWEEYPWSGRRVET